MKQFIFLLIASLAILYSKAQNIGIGTTAPDASSKLEISSNNSGLLIPRLTAVQRIAISNPANGLLVFDTDSAAFAYRSGSTWLFLKGNNTKANDWSTVGNAGTGANNFIGTTDLQPLRFRVNNVNAGLVDSTAFNTGNTGLGFRSLDSITLGTSNTAIGFKSLSSNSSGNNNTANGFEALYFNREGFQNTANGAAALYSNISGNQNTANGFESLFYNTTGYQNTANGYLALNANSTGFQNAANGAFSLYRNTTGNSNTANGLNALFGNTTGNSNTANGAYSLASNLTGSTNTANGAYSLASNTTGERNTANGYEALELNTTGERNTANGTFSMVSNSTGSSNTANGYFSLYGNTTGRVNTANGNYSLYKNTTGSFNTASGDSSLANNTDGAYNSAFGSFALTDIISGDFNTAVGYDALGSAAYVSRYNTAIGAHAGAHASNGSNNVFVGYGASMLGGQENVVSIGQGTLVPTSNTVRLGNSSTIRYQAFTDWTNISDGRFKNNVKENVPGLAFINKLRPVTYNLAATALDKFFHRNYKDSTDKKNEELKAKSLREKEQITYTGFIAQEVEASAKELGFEFSGVDAPKNENDTYGLRYAQFVVPLVKAVQELCKQNEALKKQVEQSEIPAIVGKQQQEIEALKKEVQLLKAKLK